MQNAQKCGDRGNYQFAIDSSCWISSDIKDTSEYQFRSGSPHGQSFADKYFVEQLLTLESTIKGNDLEKCEKLSKNIRDINGIFHFVGNSIASYTLLHKAVELKKIKFVEILLKNGANPNIVNSDGISPLTLASKINDSEILELIKSKSIVSDEDVSISTYTVDFMKDPRVLRQCSSYSANIFFENVIGASAKLSFFAVGEKYSEIYDLTMSVTVEKASKNGINSYRFTAEGNSQISKDKISLTVIPGDYNKYLLSSNGLSEKKSEDGCIIS